jgi:hypothetical protein
MAPVHRLILVAILAVLTMRGLEMMVGGCQGFRFNGLLGIAGVDRRPFHRDAVPRTGSPANSRSPAPDKSDPCALCIDSESKSRTRTLAMEAGSGNLVDRGDISPDVDERNQLPSGSSASWPCTRVWTSRGPSIDTGRHR